MEEEIKLERIFWVKNSEYILLIVFYDFYFCICHTCVTLYMTISTPILAISFEIFLITYQKLGCSNFRFCVIKFKMESKRILSRCVRDFFAQFVERWRGRSLITRLFNGFEYVWTWMCLKEKKGDVPLEEGTKKRVCLSK